MIIKDSATVVGKLHPAIEHAMNVVDRVWRRVVNTQPVCTGLQEEGHSLGSLHYGISGDMRCRAFDIRTRSLNRVLSNTLKTELEMRLGVLEYDIIWEPNHLHIEYQPKE